MFSSLRLAGIKVHKFFMVRAGQTKKMGLNSQLLIWEKNPKKANLLAGCFQPAVFRKNGRSLMMKRSALATAIKLASTGVLA
ncbi:hypothetical protein, partial [Marinobacter sp.]|uniref:hypothetical protein n=1 Tax=Marinobacter sp. TaxID=50741 RepID=UPI002B45E218